MNRLVRGAARRAWYLGQYGRELATRKEFYPPGHFYSPIPSIKDVKRYEHQVFDSNVTDIPGVDLNDQGQVQLFDELARFIPEQPWAGHQDPDVRYSFENEYYGVGEALILYCMIRHVAPHRIIEIGSGFSSCAMLDTNELSFNKAIACTFIEPYPDRLLAHLKEGDLDQIALISAPLQDVETSVFAELQAGDMLFVDSTHVAKVNSDVNHIFFRILPALADGVYIHFHDIPFPFEYPKDWVYRGRAWNEVYMLRAFLQYNPAFRIMFSNSYFAQVHQEMLRSKMPLATNDPGSSMWLRKEQPAWLGGAISGLARPHP